MAGDAAEELERFRQQWQQEVTQRVKEAPSASLAISPRPPSQSISGATLSPPLIRRETRETEEHAEDLGGEGYCDLEDKDEERRLGEDGERIHPSIKQEPRSALDHYELAVERELEGSLGDSLNHYRKAYRLDAAVDRIYKNKHFPPSFKSKPTNPSPSNAAVTVPNPSDESEELTAEPASCRCSTRTRLPAPSKAPPGAPSFIPVRRADGADPVVLQKSQAQELAVSTRANTRRNKGQSKRPLLALQDLPTESVNVASEAKQRAERAKSVAWAERLASYQDAHNSLDGPPASTISELISSFSSIPIPGQEPPTDRSPQSPCPISTIPSEILINVLLETAIVDVASFARLSLVCKRLAYLVATEDRIWKRVCLGPEFGFSAMHYKWTCSTTGGPLPSSVGDLDVGLESIDLTDTAPLPDPFALSPTYPSYRDMFQNRPRLRFNGCYISTVNYIRPGGNTASHVTWNTPVHIVTYYRYLRFFRDGRCASLLTTSEPTDVVHYLTKENMHTRHAGGLPSAVMNNCLRGRWKLSGDPYRTTTGEEDKEEEEQEKEEEEEEEEEEDQEGTIHIETEGADAGQANPKYIYKMALQLKRAGRSAGATRNNKLTWIGYWSYNRLADDWAEFGLKNDKAFLWSRVRSYGTGE